MARRKRRQRAAAKSRPQRTKQPSRVAVSLEPSLRQRFPDGLPPEPEPEPPPPPPRQVMTEAEVMRAVFHGAPFDPERVEIVERAPRPPVEDGEAGARQEPRGRVGQAGGAGGAGGAGRAGLEEKAGREEREGREEKAGQAGQEEKTAAEMQASRERSGSAADDERLRAIQERAWAGSAWSDAPPPPPAERAALTEDERRIVTAARRSKRVPTLKLRGLGRAAAIEALVDFVSLHQAAGRRYVRVVTGKGIGSPGEPVLKHTFVAWCAGEGAEWVDGYAPDREVSLEFGAFVLALLRPDDRP